MSERGGELTRDGARAMLLAAQGLERPPTRAATRDDLLTAIRRMGVLQIDTINVIARSPYLVLFSRIGAFELRWLEELLAERQIFEYWSHEASFLPIEDYGYSLAFMRDSSGRSARYAQAWIAENRALVDTILERVRDSGPVRSSDFVRSDGQKGSWWNWKVEKYALEMLYTSGELMIAGRVNFQRIYDLRERVLPMWDAASPPTMAATRRAQALLAVRALGVAPARWVADYFRSKTKPTLDVMRELVDDSALIGSASLASNSPGTSTPITRRCWSERCLGRLIRA